MVNTVEGAGAYKLKQFQISNFLGETRTVKATTDVESVETMLLMDDWSLNESIHSANIHGAARITDAIGLYYDFPLRGEELLTVKYEDYYGNERTENLFIFSISNMSSAKGVNSDILSYTIHFVSVGKFVADTSMLRRAYKGKISDIVSSVFEEYYTNSDNDSPKEIEIEDTLGEQTIVVPNYNTSEAMSFLARRAYGGLNNTSTFKFFETREKYYFVTTEYLFENSVAPPYTFIYNVVKDETPSGQINKMKGIIDFSFSEPIDTLQDLYDGTYHKRVTELDYVNRKTIKTDYSYFDDMPDYNSKLGVSASRNLVPNHSKEFVDRFLRQGKNVMVVKDYPDATMGNMPSLRPKPYYAEQISASWAVTQHHSKNKMQVKIYGRNDLYAGDVVIMDLDEFRFAPSKQDMKLSGKYLVESIANEFVGDVFYQTLIISRGGIGE